MLFAAVQAFSHQTCCRVATTAACALPIYVALYNTKTKLKPAIMILKVMLNMGVNNVIQMCVCVCGRHTWASASAWTKLPDICRSKQWCYDNKSLSYAQAQSNYVMISLSAHIHLFVFITVHRSSSEKWGWSWIFLHVTMVDMRQTYGDGATANYKHTIDHPFKCFRFL